MADAALLNGIAECGDDMGLANEVGESLRAIPPGNHCIRILRRVRILWGACHNRIVLTLTWTVEKRTPHKSTPFRAASYFRPDPFRGSPSRSPLFNSRSLRCAIPAISCFRVQNSFRQTGQPICAFCVFSWLERFASCTPEHGRNAHISRIE